jgi:hypothetical protein
MSTPRATQTSRSAQSNVNLACLNLEQRTNLQRSQCPCYIEVLAQINGGLGQLLYTPTIFGQLVCTLLDSAIRSAVVGREAASAHIFQKTP